MVKISFIFLIGRPGSGKTTVYRLLQKPIQDEFPLAEIINLDDFTIIQEIMEDDTEFIKHRRPPDGGFEIIDQTVYDDALRRINKRLLDILNSLHHHNDHKTLVFVQFARSSYINAFRFFDPDVIRRSLLIYLDSSFEICWERNLHRADENTEENHYVPRDVMEQDYFLDDRPVLEKWGFGEIVVINNNSEDKKVLELQLTKKIIHKLRDRIRRPRRLKFERLWQLDLFEPDNSLTIADRSDR